VFSRNVSFSDVIATFVAAVPKHLNLKRDLGKKDETSFRYVLGHPEGSNRELTVTVMAFNTLLHGSAWALTCLFCPK